MAQEWKPLPLDKPFFANLDQDAIVGAQTAIENGFINEKGGHTRFPGLIERVDFGDNSRVYLNDLNGDLVAANSKGQIYRINRAYQATNVTGVPTSGGRRTIFAKTDRELLMASGGPIVRYRADKTELLSANAPLATHVGWIDGYTIATEMNSGRFFNSGANTPDQWNPLDTFSASGNPDNINSMLITPFRELMLGGVNSVEQFERLPTGTVPFFRRWAVGDGVKFPYVLLFADNAMWTVNNLTELVRFSGQLSTAASADIGKLLESVDDWTDAFLGGYPDRPLHIIGQKFMLLQIPNATNAYGTKGITLLFDYRNKRFSNIFGWDNKNGVPTRYPAWSHWTLWNKVFVGGEGKIYELSQDVYNNGGTLQRWLVRTAHIAEHHQIIVSDLRLRLTRGRGTSDTEATIRVRCSRDGRPFGPWITRGLGKAGDRVPFKNFGNFGNGNTFMFEISSSDDCRIDLISGEVLTEDIGH